MRSIENSDLVGKTIISISYGSEFECSSDKLELHFSDGTNLVIETAVCFPAANAVEPKDCFASMFIDEDDC